MSSLKRCPLREFTVFLRTFKGSVDCLRQRLVPKRNGLGTTCLAVKDWVVVDVVVEIRILGNNF